MNEETLKNYFQICKKFDPKDFYNILQNIENRNFNNFPNLNSEEIECIQKLKNYFGNNDKAKQELMNLYTQYHLVKGGATSSKSLSSISDFFKKNLSADKIKSTVTSSAKLVGSLLKSSASVIYKYAESNPDGTVDFIKTIHNNTTKVLLDDIIKDDKTKTNINNAFEKIFESIRGALKGAATTNPNPEEKSAETPGEIPKKQKGGYYNDDEEEDLMNFNDDYNVQTGGRNQYSGMNMSKNNQLYNENYNNDNFGNQNYSNATSDFDNNQDGGAIDDNTSYFDSYQDGGAIDDNTSDYDNYQQGGQYEDDYNDNNISDNYNYEAYSDTSDENNYDNNGYSENI